MSPGHRYGMAAGFALTPIMFDLLFHYRAPDLHLLRGWEPWLWIAAPVVTWVGTETSAHLWRQTRWVGQMLSPVAGAGAVAWWWWVHGLFTWGGASETVGSAVPTGIVGIYLVLAIISGRSLGRANTSRRTREPDAVPR